MTPTDPDQTSADGAYGRLLSFLDSGRARYRIIEHPDEGRTDVVSGYRGNPVAAAAKCMVVMVKIGKKTSRYFLAVVAGDARVDLNAVKGLVDGTYVSFASTDRAEALAGSIAGTILPFTFNPDLELIVDPGLLVVDEIFFNAARLDRSLALSTEDYIRLAGPRLEPIAAA